MRNTSAPIGWHGTRMMGSSPKIYLGKASYIYSPNVQIFESDWSPCATIYSLRIGFISCLGQRHGLQNTTLTSCFYKKYLWKSDICILLWKYFSRQIYSYNFYICKLNNLKVIDDLYFQCLFKTLSKTTSKSDTEGVYYMIIENSHGNQCPWKNDRLFK
jgi:hypothetical protein